MPRRRHLDTASHALADELRETMEELRDALREGTYQNDDSAMWNKKLEDLHKALRQAVGKG